MKNIYLIPTNEPSRLSIIENKLLLSHAVNWESKPIDWEEGDGVNQYIYITSDGEIKKGNPVIYDFGMGYQLENPCDPDNLKSNTRSKIILTTDPQLIEQGIQAIDDDFLQWFIKNPTVEFVKVLHGFETGIFGTSYREYPFEYRIDIPEEEPKQEQFYTEEDMINFALFVLNRMKTRTYSEIKTFYFNYWNNEKTRNI